MRSSNTFGVHFVLRRMAKTHSIFARITVNGTRCELALKQTIDLNDWNAAKGTAKPKTPTLKQLTASWRKSGPSSFPTTSS